MLRKAPLNYLAAACLAVVLWIATGLLLGNYLGENVSLQVMTSERFLAVYRITTVVASALALGICCMWFSSGAKPAAATDPRSARKRWVGLMISQALLGPLALIVLVVMYLSESLTAADYVMILGGFIVDTVIFFWFSTLLMSPRPVMAVVPGKR